MYRVLLKVDLYFGKLNLFLPLLKVLIRGDRSLGFRSGEGSNVVEVPCGVVPHSARLMRFCLASSIVDGIG